MFSCIPLKKPWNLFLSSSSADGTVDRTSNKKQQISPLDDSAVFYCSMSSDQNTILRSAF